MTTPYRIIRSLALLALLILSLQPSTTRAQGTAFTYQGHLVSGGVPVNGSYDLRFTLFATNTGGTPIAGPVTNTATTVSNGLFTTTIDLGAGAFLGNSNWLDIVVSTNGSVVYQELTPRQEVTPTPYAIFARNASSVAATNLSGFISLAQLPSAVLTNKESNVSLAGAFSGDGSGLTNVAPSGYISVFFNTSTPYVLAANNPVTFNGQSLYSGWLIGANTLIVVKTGVYLIQFEANSTSSTFGIGAQINGAAVASGEATGSGTAGTPVSHSFITSLSAGSVVQFVNVGPTSMTLVNGAFGGLAFSTTIVRLN